MELWYKVANPRKELREGRSLDPSEFAVHLDQIVNGSAPEEYRDPTKFFLRTYFASALVDYCGMVLRRLSGEIANTAPVLSLITQFGGGKTHTLATLYHLVNNGPKAREYQGVPELLERIGLSEVPRARVAVFVGNAWDSEEGRETPWIDIAYQLAGDAGRRLLGDEARVRSPGTSTLQKLFAIVNEPILILFDETLNYVARYRDHEDQFHSFVQNLTSALTSTKQAVGLLSLPASPTEMTERLYEWQTKLTKVVGRLGKPLIATDPEEVSEIIRRRLFEDPGRRSMQQAAGRQFARWVFERRDRLPPEFANFPEEVIRRQFEMCYPFHPSTLTVFQRKWQSLATFQQTRGTLAMLGLWISRAYSEGYRRAWREPLLTLGSAPLYDREFRSKLLDQLGESRLEAAIEYDIAGENAHAISLDKELANGVGAMRLHQRVATAIFFESCGGMVHDKVATLPDLRFSLGDPDVETTLIDMAVQALETRCYYLRPVGAGGWRFGYTPTLRKVHADRKAGLDPGYVDVQLREVVRKVFRDKAKIDIGFFPKDSNEITDRSVLSLAVLSPDQEFDESLKSKLTEWTRNYGQSPRQYSGGVLWIIPESAFGLRASVEDWLAWQTIMNDTEQGLLGDLEEHDKRMIRSELQNARDAVEEKVWSTYNRLLLWNGKDGELREIRMGQMHQSQASCITAALMARLRQEGLLNREIGASYIKRHWPPALKESGAWPLASLKAAFFQGNFTRLEKAEDALKQMLLGAVQRGELGLGVGGDPSRLERIWFKELIDPAEIKFDHETYVLLKLRAEYEKAQVEIPVKPKEAEEEKPDDRIIGGITIPKPDIEPEPEPEKPQEIEWRGQLPKDKWNLLSHRVLTKIGNSEDVTIEVAIRATVKDSSVKQQLNTALRDLGLEGEFSEVKEDRSMQEVE